jgi:hypothetical protein
MTRKKGHLSQAETSAPVRRKLLIDQDKEKVVNFALKKFRQKALAQQQSRSPQPRSRTTTSSYIADQIDLSALRTYISSNSTVPIVRERPVPVDPVPPPTIYENPGGVVVTGQHQNGAASYAGITPVPLGPEHGSYYEPQEIQGNNIGLQSGETLRYEQELDNNLRNPLVYGSSTMRVPDSHIEHISQHQSLLAHQQAAEELVGSAGIPTYYPRQIPTNQQNIRIPNYQQFPTSTTQLNDASNSFFNSTHYTSMVSERTLTREAYELEENMMFKLSLWFPWVSDITLRYTAMELQARDIHHIAFPPPTWDRSRSAHDRLHQYAMTPLRYQHQLDIYQVAIGIYKLNATCGILKAVNLSRWINQLDANIPQDEQLEITWNQ